MLVESGHDLVAVGTLVGGISGRGGSRRGAGRTDGAVSKRGAR